MQGLGLLSMSTPPVFGPCSDYKEECIGHKQKVLFYISLLLIAAGMAGHLVSIGPLLSQQSESENEKEKGNENDNGNENEQNSGAETEEIDIKFMQVPGFFMVIVVLITGGVGLPYIKPWSLRFGIPTICSVVATLWFFTGFREYKHTEPNGSPLTTTLRVFVATARNISQPIPNREELSNEEDARSTSSLRSV
ncbi:putative proton-dependent oligopeptide transporter family, MFS transporter superfamily [Helianthus annuus]|nr:putative proton-dependent oligopeptide transporter family, MFS transporter superfamily [Helianthus annuus]